MRASRLGRSAAVVAVLLFMALAVPAALADTPGSKSECETDTTYSVKVCFTMSYEKGLYKDNLTTIALNNYHFILTRMDPTVAIQSATIHAGISGKDTAGHVYLADAASKTFSSPSTGATHTFAPWWASPTRRLILPNGDVPGVYQCGNVVVTLHRGGTTWKLSSENICWGALLGNPFAGDR
jgi:hypothetical protein